VIHIIAVVPFEIVSPCIDTPLPAFLKVVEAGPEDSLERWTAVLLRLPTKYSITFQHFLAQHQVTALPHAPYSPDLSPCDFIYFHDLKQQGKAIAIPTFEPLRQP
jgi:hypothetical protein